MAKEPEPIVIGGGFGGFITTAAVLISIVIVVGLWAHHQPPRDDSDPIDGRSNMSVLTDALTGCQYLTTSRGGITPRWTRDGEQVCK